MMRRAATRVTAHAPALWSQATNHVAGAAAITAALAAATASQTTSCDSISLSLDVIQADIGDIKKALKPVPPVTALKYWNGRGLMDVPRAMLAISGKFPNEAYKDIRMGDPAEVAAKGGDASTITPYPEVMNSLDANLGRVPTLETADGSIGQSAAINFYVAAECGMLGDSTFEAASILCMCEHVKELGQAYYALCPYGSVPTAETQAKFFDSNVATDFTGPAVMSKRSERFLKWYLGRLENLVGGDGFAVGGKLSLADVIIWNAFGNGLTCCQSLGDLPAWRREPFGSKAKTNAALEACPKVKAIVDRVAAHPNIQKWLAARGLQAF